MKNGTELNLRKPWYIVKTTHACLTRFYQKVLKKLKNSEKYFKVKFLTIQYSAVYIFRIKKNKSIIIILYNQCIRCNNLN